MVVTLPSDPKKNLGGLEETKTKNKGNKANIYVCNVLVTKNPLSMSNIAPKLKHREKRCSHCVVNK